MKQTMKRISKEEASTKYGVLTKYDDVKYYLTSNGNIVDSDGNLRYLAKENENERN